MNKEKAETLLENYQALSVHYSNIRKELEHTRKALEITKSYIKGISQMVINSGDNIYIVIGHFKKLAEQTLKQIEHKEKQ